MIAYFKDILVGFYSLLVGMAITLRHVVRRPVTVDYPFESLPMKPRYRGPVELVVDEGSGEPVCMACLACQKACPSGCIAIEGHKPEGATRRVTTLFTLNFTTCSLCGLCVESCNFEGLRFSKAYNLASQRRQDFQMDLLRQARERKRP